MGTTLARAGLVALLAIAALSVAVSTPGVARADHLACHAPNRGFSFETFELEDNQVEYSRAIELSVQGKGVPAAYTLASGERIDVSYQGLSSGARSARQNASKALSIPPSIYKSIAHIEADYANADGNTYYGQVGGTLLSGDCGYGIGQITSGMGHLAAPPARDIGVPSARQAIIGTHFMFNIAEGVRILADKWNSAPNFRPIAGNGDPAVLEDWYYAIWSYNGFAFSNHPLSPNRDPLRGEVYHCYDPYAPELQTGKGYGDYTYPERVYGCMKYPPVLRGTKAQPPVGAPVIPVPATPIAVGDSVAVSGTGSCANLRPTPAGEPPIECLPDGSVATITGGPTEAAGNTWWKVSTSAGNGWMAALYLKKPAPPQPQLPVNPANRVWAPQVFQMPNFTIEAIASAFRPANFLDCSEETQSTGFSGCPSMDYPTSIPEFGVVPHGDSTPPPDPALAYKYLRDPFMTVVGPSSFALTFNGSTSSSGTVTVKNTGTWIAPFRVRTSATWIQVQRSGTSRIIDGGVAIGSDTEVVTQRANSAQGTPRVAQNGWDSVLQIVALPDLMAAGANTGKVYIEPLLGGGAPVEITVTATRPAGSGGGSTPTPTPVVDPRPFKAVIPGLKSEGSY